MPTQGPRVNVVLDQQLFCRVENIANRDGRFLSLEIRDLLKGARRCQRKDLP